jgi:hypothetical protein
MRLFRTKWSRIGLPLLVVAVVCAALVGHRALRLAHVAKDWRAEIRYLIENGGTIGEVPASEAFEDGYLEAIFGSDPDLLSKLRGVIAKGLAEDPTLSLGEVAAMIVTYQKGEDNRVENVVAHVVGGFPLGQRRPGFHRDGYFSVQIDPSLWQAGNSLIGFLGRDIVLFADESVANRQQGVLESMLSGDILPLAEVIGERPMFFTAVFPDPRRVVPPQLRPHIQAVIMKGMLAPYEGNWETIVLTPRPESASYALSVIYDMKLAAQLALQSRFQGVVLEQAWGPSIPVWWAHEMANTTQRTSLEKEQNIVRLRVAFERVMVNAVLKSLERMGRDMAQMRGSMDEKLDPRLVDARLRTAKPLHYWSDPHRWGPDWPIPMPTNTAAGSESDVPAPDSPPVTQPL